MKHRSDYTRHRKPMQGFTLIELLVVIAVIGLLVAISIPSLSKAKKTAQRITCLSNLRGLGQGIMLYLANNNDTYFPKYTGDWSDSVQGYSSLWNYKITDYLMAPGGVKGAEAWRKLSDCPAAKQTKMYQSDNFSASTSYRYSFYAINHFFHIGEYGLKATQVKNPSVKLLLADGVNWKLYMQTAYILRAGTWRMHYKVSTTDDMALVDNRHDGKGNVDWADGHVSSHDLPQMGNNRFYDKDLLEFFSPHNYIP